MKNIFGGKSKSVLFYTLSGALLLFTNVHAELPENVKFCIPKQYRVTYDCGELGGVAPDSVSIGYGQNFTTAPYTYCGGARWRVNDTDTIISGGTTLPYPYANDITLHAVPWCNPGMFPDGNKCVDCGYGHYCMGGDHRAVCSGGIVGCNSMNNTTDSGMDERMANRTLTSAEVNKYVPETNLDQWERVECCANSAGAGAGNYNTIYKNLNLINTDSVPGCQENSSLIPGTYAFFGRYNANSIDALWGNIAVLNRNASYKIIHSKSIFSIFIDSAHDEFTQYDIRTPTNENGVYEYYGQNKNITNIDNISDIIQFYPIMMCVYRLR